MVKKLVKPIFNLNFRFLRPAPFGADKIEKGEGNKSFALILLITSQK
jgi:hypothetical protein